MTFIHPKPGFELDWLASDAAGHVAFFSSAGHGPVPRRVVEQLSDVEAAISRLQVLPVIGSCADCPSDAGEYSFWVHPARRGLFGYEWGPVDRPPYARLAVPSRPLLIEEIDDTLIREVASLVKLDIYFAEHSAISDDDLQLFGASLYQQAPDRSDSQG
jgi:hypothetical protein